MNKFTMPLEKIQPYNPGRDAGPNPNYQYHTIPPPTASDTMYSQRGMYQTSAQNDGFYIPYDIWKKMVDTIEEADESDLTALLTPFLAELGPLAPIVAGALSMGGKELILMIVKGLPHLYPASTGIPAVDANNQPSKLGMPLVPLRPALKRPPEAEGTFDKFIRPVVPIQFAKRPISNPKISALIYPRKTAEDSKTGWLVGTGGSSHRGFYEVGPNATCVRVGF